MLRRQRLKGVMLMLGNSGNGVKNKYVNTVDRQRRNWYFAGVLQALIV